jgi:uncharacterized repeat protein (TIGR03987 family)
MLLRCGYVGLCDHLYYNGPGALYGRRMGRKGQKDPFEKTFGFFWAGLAFDTLGTSLMSRIAGGGFTLNTHGVSGILAIALMLTHAVWATCVFFKGSVKQKSDFHKFSIVVWLIWLVPYFSGLIAGISL